MGDYKEDTNQKFGTIFFIILVSLFALIFSAKSESKTTASLRYSLQYELVSGNISSHYNAVICKVVSLPDIQKYCECALPNTSLNQFSIQNKISDYNRETAQNFILIQKTRLSTGPLLPLSLFFHRPPNKDDDLPVLS
jgi:hypothetical protein